MKNITKIFCFFLIINSLTSNAQIYKIDGHVCDSLTRQNLAFVNIVINNDGTLGTTTDIDGNFEIKSRNEMNTLTFSYVGYKTKTLKVDDVKKMKNNISLAREDVELQEVIVHAGENPAHRIIDSVLKYRKRNNPENLDSYSYVIYDRMILTLDTTLITDSALMNFNKVIKRNDMMVMETVSEIFHKKPNKDKREIKANIISGLEYQNYFYILDGMQSTSFYDNFVKINNKDYVNPITPGSTSNYFFNIESKMPTESGDTIFQISYRPRKGKNFNALSGILTIHSDGWAIANVKAQPAEQEKSNSPLEFKLKIQQLYAKVNDSVWFPQQLNTDVEFFNMLISNDKTMGIAASPNQENSFKLIGIGKSYISNIKINEEIPNKIFGNTEIDIAENSGNQSEDFWRNYRSDSLSQRFAKTDAFVNRMEKRFNINADKLLDEAMTIAETTCIPIGYVNLNLNDILKFNNADGFYIGIGGKTNTKLSSRVSVGAYGGYWFKSKKMNYGGDFRVRMDKKHNFDLNIAFDRRFHKVGDYGFSGKEYSILDESHFRDFYIDWTTLNTSVSAELSCRFGKIFHGFAKFDVSGINNNYHDINNYWGEFNVSKLDFRLRIAFGERLMGGQNGLVVVEKGEPVIWIGYQKGLKNIFDCRYNFDKIQLQYSDCWKFRYFGTTSLTLQAGYVFGDAPFNEIFNIYGTKSGFGLYSTESFLTMKPTEFFCDRFVALFFNHNFGKLFSTTFFKPELIFITNIGLGDLSVPEKYSFTGYEMRTLKDGYYESGLAVENFLDCSMAHLGFACLYRYGSYSFDKVKDNFAFSLKVTFSF